MRTLRAVAVLVVAAFVGAADTAAAFELQMPPGRVAEGGQVQLWVVREPGDPDRVRLQTVSGTARAGEDFEEATIELGPNDFGVIGSSWALVNTTWDFESGEPDETFTVRTDDGSASAPITIQDYSPDLTGLQVTPPYFTPGEREGATWADVTATNDGDRPLVVDYRTSDAFGTAHDDYVPAAGRLTFPPGTSTQRLRIEVPDNDVFEGSNDFWVLFTGDRIYDRAHRMSIADDDYPRLTIDDASVREGDGPTTLRFRLRISNPSEREEWAVMTTTTASPGGALEGADFTPTEAKVVFPPGALEAWFEVPVAGDELDEDAEGLWAYPRYLAGLQGGMGAMARGTIEDDDSAPDVAVAPPRLLDLRTVAVSVRCPAGPEACAGRLSVSFSGVASAAASTRRRIRLAAGRRATVRVRVPRAQQRRLRRGASVRVRATATVRGADGDVGRRASVARVRLGR